MGGRSWGSCILLRGRLLTMPGADNARIALDVLNIANGEGTAGMEADRVNAEDLRQGQILSRQSSKVKK